VIPGFRILAACAALGLATGLISALMTKSVYFWEDRFQRLRLHWMWWPALGAIAVGLGGLLEPRALGVGYDVIGDFLGATLSTEQIVSLVVVKWAIWSVALGSGTSGGVLAPLLIVGSGLGGVASLVLPYEGAGFWPLISMGAILGAMMRAPLTGVIFAVELTHDYDALLPLLVACAVAHGFSSLVMKRSILTEKIARRGYHLTREYQVDPLEVLFVRDVMRTAPAIPTNALPSQVEALLHGKGGSQERLYAIVDPAERLVGVATRVNLEEWSRDGHETSLAAIAVEPVVAYADESLREIAYRMAESRRTRLPVVDRDDPKKLRGLITLRLLLSARLRHSEEEKRRERIFTAGIMIPRSLRRPLGPTR
jgi:CBS domain-containing protein